MNSGLKLGLMSVAAGLALQAGNAEAAVASHRFYSRVEALLQVQNLGDRYINDYYAVFAALGRQVRAGLRLRAP